MTPSEWRQQNLRKIARRHPELLAKSTTRAAVLLILFALNFFYQCGTD